MKCARWMVLLALITGASVAGREIISLDFDWRFHRGEIAGALSNNAALLAGHPLDSAYDDSSWQSVRVPHDYIFTGPQGEPLKNVKRAFKTALKKAGIEDFHFHDLRHTSASYLVMRGASMKAVQVHLGHTSIAMTERYAHLSPDFLRSEVERLSGFCLPALPTWRGSSGVPC